MESEDDKPVKKRKRAAKRTTTAKSTATKPTTAKPAIKAKAGTKDTAKAAKKLFTDKLKEIEKEYLATDQAVKKMDPNSWAITVDTYAYRATKHVATATKLSEMGADVLAFNFMLALADSSHRSASSHKMSGEGGKAAKKFKILDQALLPLIAAREVPERSDWLKEDELPDVPHRWSEDDAEVGEFKTGRPNKQQRNLMENHFIEWEKERRAARRARMEKCEDWVMSALVDLRNDRDYLKEFGVGQPWSSKG